MIRRGFTIIELLVTMIIISLLITAASAGVVRSRKTGRDGQRVRDILVIGTAIDQAATSNRGVYPINPSGSTNVMCAHILGSQSSNTTNNINLALFLSREIPRDPLPELPSSSCTSFRNGYTYNNRETSSNNLARPVSGQHYEYALEVGLESDLPSDAQTLVRGTSTSSTVRSQFILRGKPCSTGPSGTCSKP